MDSDNEIFPITVAGSIVASQMLQRQNVQFITSSEEVTRVQPGRDNSNALNAVDDRSQAAG